MTLSQALRLKEDSKMCLFHFKEITKEINKPKNETEHKATTG